MTGISVVSYSIILERQTVADEKVVVLPRHCTLKTLLPAYDPLGPGRTHNPLNTILFSALTRISFNESFAFG
jgi:hypothetical protein